MSAQWHQWWIGVCVPSDECVPGLDMVGYYGLPHQCVTATVDGFVVECERAGVVGMVCMRD